MIHHLFVKKMKTLLEQLYEAQEKLKNAKGTPENMYHPDYGWIIKDGMPTHEGAKWLEDNEEVLNDTQTKTKE